MQIFERALIDNHAVDLRDANPDFIGTVDLGESFVMETADSNMVNGPIGSSRHPRRRGHRHLH